MLRYGNLKILDWNASDVLLDVDLTNWHQNYYVSSRGNEITVTANNIMPSNSGILYIFSRSGKQHIFLVFVKLNYCSSCCGDAIIRSVPCGKCVKFTDVVNVILPKYDITYNH